MSFVPEKENEFIAYYILQPKKGRGCLVSAFNGQQAIAKANYLLGEFKAIVCVKSI